MDEIIEPSKYKFDSVFIAITKAFIVLSTMFLIIGVSYSFGSDSGYGISSALPSTEISTFLGFLMFFGVFEDVINALFSGMIDYWYLILAGIFGGLGIGVSFHLIFFFIPSLKRHEQRFEQKLNNFSLTSASLGSLFFVLSFLSLFPVTAFTAGKLNSGKVIEQLRDYGCSRSYKDNSDWSLCTEVFVNGVSILKGYMIYRRPNEVAFITLEKQELIIRSVPENVIIKRMRME